MEDTEKPTPKRDVWERVKARREREGVLDEKVRGVPTAPLAQPPSAPVGVVASSSTAADDGESFGGGDGADLVNYLEGRIRRNKPLTDAQVEKLRKRQRAEGVLSGISDAVRSVVNLGYTNKYAPNMYDATKSMSAKTQARFDKEKAERDARDADYYNDVMALTRFKQGLADRAYQRGRDARKDAEEKAKSDNAAKISEIKYRKAMGELDDAEAAREEYAANKEYRDALAAAKLDEVKSRAERNRRPNVVRSGGSGKPAEHPWTDKKGNVHYVHSESAARGNAATFGGTYNTTPVETKEEYDSSTKDDLGNEKKSHNTKITTKDSSTKGKKKTGVTWK